MRLANRLRRRYFGPHGGGYRHAPDQLTSAFLTLTCGHQEKGIRDSMFPIWRFLVRCLHVPPTQEIRGRVVARGWRLTREKGRNTGVLHACGIVFYLGSVRCDGPSETCISICLDTFCEYGVCRYPTDIALVLVQGGTPFFNAQPLFLVLSFTRTR